MSEQPTELRLAFHEALDAVSRDITVLAGYVTEAVPKGTEALLTNDLKSAQRLIDGDDELDRLAIDIEERCYKLLALEAPVAGELRQVITAIRLTIELERSGDLVVNVCKAARRVYPVDLPPVLRGLLTKMSDEAAKLVRISIDAYAEADASLAAALDDIDDRLDALHADYIAEVLDWGRDNDVQPAVQLALVGRYYERIGDHAVNIGERVRYMVDGWLPEQTGAARAKAGPPAWMEPDDMPGELPSRGEAGDG